MPKLYAAKTFRTGFKQQRTCQTRKTGTSGELALLLPSLIISQRCCCRVSSVAGPRLLDGKNRAITGLYRCSDDWEPKPLTPNLRPHPWLVFKLSKCEWDHQEAQLLVLLASK